MSVVTMIELKMLIKSKTVRLIMMTVDRFSLFFTGGTTENEIPVFPSTTVLSTFSRHHNRPPSPSHVLKGDLKKKRILKFLRNFRLDFSKFDTTCIKREGRGLQAPSVSHARVVKYTR